jgi:hypothetical protein
METYNFLPELVVVFGTKIQNEEALPLMKAVKA